MVRKKTLRFGRLEVLGIGLFQAVAQLMVQMDLHAIYSNCCCSLQFYTQNRIFQASFNEEKKNEHFIAFCLKNIVIYQIVSDFCF